MLIAIITVLMFNPKDLPNLVNRVETTLLPDFYYKIPKNYQYLLSKDEME